MIGAATTLGFYTAITLFYFVLKYLLVENFHIINTDTYPHGLNNVLSIVYYALVIFIQYYINVKNTYIKCGVSQVFHAAIYTFIPNILIFGLLVTILDVFPGFLKPFSNTIGYFIVYWMGGISKVFNNMLISKHKSKYIQQVYDNNSLMINEITTGPRGNIIDFIKHAAEPGPDRLFNSNYKKFLPTLFNLVVVKNLISKFIWYILVGGLVISTSYNSIVNMECRRDSETQQKLDNEDKKKQEKINTELKKNKNVNTKVFF
jgi:hypothetical protein